MKLKEPLVFVLVGQLVVMAGAVGFMAARGSPEAAPKARRHVEAEPEAEPEVHAPLPKLAALAAPEPEAHAEAPEHAETPKTPAPVEVAPEGPVAPPKAAPVTPNTFEALISTLSEGNARFVDGVTRQRDVVALRGALAAHERADAVVVTCTDSRVVPELIFDQPLGTFTVVRVPGAQLDDASAKAVEEATKRLQTHVVLVLGHVGCHHVEAALATAPKKKVARPATLSSALSGLQAGLDGAALDEAAVAASVSFTTKELRRRSKALARATDLSVLRLMYSPTTGAVRWLDAEPEAAPAPAPRAGRR